MGFHAYAMKTQLLSAYNYYPKYNLSLTQQQNNTQISKPVLSIQPEDQVNFTGKRHIGFLIRNLHLDPLYHFSKYSKEEYAKLSLHEIENLRARSLSLVQNSHFEGVKALDDIHSIVPTVLKDMFDKFYGAGEYVVVLLGRSLSTIGDALGYRIGEKNVINLPMSWSRRFLPSTTRTGDHFEIYNKITSSHEGLDKFLVYLEKIGLGKEQVKNSEKNYILMDYCCSGVSLKGAEFLFKSDYVWGPEAKVHSVDILKALGKYDMPEFKPVQKDGVSLLSTVFCGSELKSYSRIGRAMCLKETEKAMKAVKSRYIGPKEKELIRFRILDNAVQPQHIQFNLKPNSGNFTYPKQVVIPWNDYLSQAESDIRNDIQRVNFQLLKLDVLDIYDSKMRCELNNIYNMLTDYYNTYKSHPNAMTAYYESRTQIQDCLRKAESILKDKEIFVR